MAGDDKEEKKDEEVKGKKGGLKPLIFVAIGAALGGAGVVVMSPVPKPEVNHGPAKPIVQINHHPDEMRFQFNPRVERGTKVGRVSFEFDYKFNKADEEKVVESIKKFWARARSRCLVVLTNQSFDSLSGIDGKEALRRQLVDELTLELFPELSGKDGKKKRIAIVVDVLWTDFFLQ